MLQVLSIKQCCLMEPRKHAFSVTLPLEHLFWDTSGPHPGYVQKNSENMASFLGLEWWVLCVLLFLSGCSSRCCVFNCISEMIDCVLARIIIDTQIHTHTCWLHVYMRAFMHIQYTHIHIYVYLGQKRCKNLLGHTCEINPFFACFQCC